MTQRIRFILGHGGAVAVASPLTEAPAVVAAPTASARRSAAQPKAKRSKGKVATPRQP
jgi:hypothetical protein